MGEKLPPMTPPANNAYSPTDVPDRKSLATLKAVGVLRVSDVLYASTVEELPLLAKPPANNAYSPTDVPDRSLLAEDRSLALICVKFVACE